MSAKLEAPTVAICDPEGRESVPDAWAFRVIENPRLANAKRYNNVFVLATITCLESIAAFVSAVNRRNQLRALFVRYHVDASWLPQMFEFAKLRTMRNTFAHSGFIVPHRVLSAWQLGAQNELIADARLMGDTLYVVSCEPESYKIPVSKIAPIRNLSADERSSFQIADDGSYIHWPAQDVHLDLDSLLVTIEPGRRARAEKIKRSYGKQYGEAIAHLRKKHSLTQTAVEGLSDREVRRIEAYGEVTTDSLKKLAAAHQMQPSEYMDALASLSSQGSILRDQAPPSERGAVPIVPAARGRARKKR